MCPLFSRHNRLEPDKGLHFSGAVNATNGYRPTMSYTSLVRTGPQSGFVVYARRVPGKPDVAFSMPFNVSQPM